MWPVPGIVPDIVKASEHTTVQKPFKNNQNAGKGQANTPTVRAAKRSFLVEWINKVSTRTA
jgi:hypothetical protein